MKKKDKRRRSQRRKRRKGKRGEGGDKREEGLYVKEGDKRARIEKSKSINEFTISSIFQVIHS